MTILSLLSKGKFMKTFTVTTFKTHALKVIEQIIKTRESIIITKRGKPVAEVLPYTPKDTTPIPGKLQHLLKDEKDIIAPIGEDIWNAAQ